MRQSGSTGLLALVSCLLAGPALAPDWHVAPGVRSAVLPVPADGKAGFTLLNPLQTRIAFTNQLSDASVAENQIRLIGSGVALGDVDGDGWCDIYLCRLEGPNALYRNLGGWKFQDVSADSGARCAEQFSTGCALADVDGDGDPDLLVNSIGGGTRLFFNDGKGRFSEASNAGLLRKFCATSLALADLDGDGDLDLYVANYRTATIRSTGLKVLSLNGRRVIRPEDRDEYEMTPDGFVREHGETDALYLNDGKGRFTLVSWTEGAFLDEDGKPLSRGPKEWGLSAMFRDMNGDGAPDLYVCNDFWSPDRMWMNESRDGRVRFRALQRLALRHTSTFSMGVDFADINRDGWDDFFVLDMMSRDHPRRLRQRSLMGQSAGDVAGINERPQVGHNTLFLNRGDDAYAEVAQLGGVQASEWSWGVAFLDVDLDGYEDLLITTGHGFDSQDADAEARLGALGPAPEGRAGERILQFPRLWVPNVAFRNRGDLTFEECAAKWGFDQAGVSHGIALADLDNDGDLDAAINNLNAPAGLYRNESAASRVAVRLKGRTPNTRGVGAKIRFTGSPVPQSQEMISGGRYLSSDDAVRVFAAGTGTRGPRIEVTWRNGGRSLVTNIVPNQVYEIEEASAATVEVSNPGETRPAPLFKEVFTLQHTHHDEKFDDFARQPLLPRRLSQLGPGVSWIDIDGDGQDDLVIGAGRGGSLGIFRNRGDGAFDAMRVGGALGKAPDDFTTVLGARTTETNLTLFAGQANYESGDTNLPAVRRFEVMGSRMQADSDVPGTASSPGPMALTDVDGDGDLDMFVGGRGIAGRYAEPATSRLYLNAAEAVELAQEWPQAGLVSGAVFSDLDNDGYPELILACEWGPIRIFKNHAGKFVEITDALGLGKYLGWWNGISTADLDGDGRLDLVASNWGRNNTQQSFLKDGWRLYFGDIAGRSAADLVEAIYDAPNQCLAPWHDLDTLANGIPWLRERFSSNAAFASASLEQILGDRLKVARELRVTWLDSTVFLNRGTRFEAHPLPVEAQFSPAFGVCAGDVDGDGHEDVFLAQNFFGVDERASRHDAGRGLWMRGAGKGDFAPMTAAQSGIKLYGEQRGAALCDYDADGRWDLAVAQNNAGTRLFHNDNGAPGLRVRLNGPAGNNSGIGAALRLETTTGAGLVREVHAGSGYWSQESSVQILRAPGFPAIGARLSIRWPGGKSTIANVPPGTRELRANYSGGHTVTRASSR